jgi:hypothetical protein
VNLSQLLSLTSRIYHFLCTCSCSVKSRQIWFSFGRIISLEKPDIYRFPMHSVPAICILENKPMFSLLSFFQILLSFQPFRQRVIRRESKTDSYSTGPTLFGLRCILCHNFWTNYDLDLFSTSKWPSDLQFCERYKGRCQKND